MSGSRIDVGPGAPDDIRLPGLPGRTTWARHETRLAARLPPAQRIVPMMVPPAGRAAHSLDVWP